MSATRCGFISMTRRLPSVGLTANWMLDPPVSTPTCRMQANASSRMAWYSTSESVCAGATVIESPVCTPMGSKFSIEHTTTQLSALSRMTSSSNSFHPSMDRSMRIWCTGLAASPSAATRASWVRSPAVPVPAPPKMKLGRIMRGNPIRSPRAMAASRWVANPEGGTSKPISSMALLKRSRSSAVAMASALAPISSTPKVSSTPRSDRPKAKFRPVCPPMVGSNASGRSCSTTAVSTSSSRGSIYVRSAMSGSVMIVAGLEFTSTTR